MSRAIVSVPHTVTPGNTFRLYPASPCAPFAQLMAGLYPKLASTVSVSKGYAAFTADKVFVGIMTSTGLTSIRRNPLLEDHGEQAFLRALLGGLHVDGHDTCSMYCDWDNLGTLRLMQKLGLGAKPERKNGHRSTGADPESLAYLQAAIDKARVPYSDHRVYAQRKLSKMPPEYIAKVIPRERDMIGKPHKLDVTLL